MRCSFGTVLSSGIRNGWLVWLCLSGWVSAVEYELSGVYEQFDRYPTMDDVSRLREFAKDHTPAEIKAEWDKVHIPLRTGEPRRQIDLMNRTFKVWVRDQAWCIHTRRPFNQPDEGWEHGSVDGKELYTSIGNQAHGGMGIVQYLSNPMPRSLSDYGVSMIWLMTASGRYFDTLTNNANEPGQSEVFRRATNYQAGDGQAWLWLRRDGKPGLPMACYFLDGRGRTNFSFRATGFREVGGLSLPSGFVWERYAPQFATLEGRSLRVEERIVARITNIVAHCSRKDLRARVLPNMSVADRRVKQPSNLVTNIATNAVTGITTNITPAASRKGYVVRDGKWPTAAKAQDLVDGRKRTPKDWIWAAVGAVVLLGGAVGWLRRRARRVAPPQPPSPSPTDAPSP